MTVKIIANLNALTIKTDASMTKLAAMNECNIVPINFSIECGSVGVKCINIKSNVTN
jgi:hypothetical protein